MSEKYGYLKKYHYSNYGDVIEWPDNIVYDVDPDEIAKAELLMGCQFPDQLRDFYKEMGHVRLTSPHSRPSDYSFFSTNMLLAPLVVAHFYRGIITYHEEPFDDALQYDDHYLANSILEDLEPGDLPFFEISDSSSFMIMKTKSQNPNAVWFMGFEKVEDSLEDFIRNLYYKGPDYYNENW